MTHLSTLTVFLTVMCPLVVADDAANWNQFRGPNGDGMSTATGLPTTFAEDAQNVRWKVPMPGKAWSSPVVWGDRIWLTNAPELQNPPGATNLEADGGGEFRLETPIRLSAVCLDAETGNTLHDVTVFDVYEPQFVHLTNSYASSTPVIEEGRVYVHFGTYGTAGLDTETGDKLWERRDLNVLHWRGAGSSPVVHGDLLYLTFDGYDRQYIVALNKHNGETVWHRDRDIDYGTDNGDAKKAYSTPTIVTVADRDLLISPFAMATTAYDAKTGETVWTVMHGGMNAAARPLVGNGLVYINAGDGQDALVALDPAGKGDITASHIKWRTGRMTPKRPSQLLIKDLYFMVNDEGVAVCLDALTGEEIWKSRIPGSRFWSSPLYADGNIYAFSQEGRIAVFKAAREFELVSDSKLGEGFNASPAVIGSSLILRSFSDVYRIDGPGGG